MTVPTDAIMRFLADLAPEKGLDATVHVGRASDFAALGQYPMPISLGFDGRRISSLPGIRTSDRLERLIGLDALRPAERFLRIGWLWLCGTVDEDGQERPYFLPLLSASVTFHKRVLHYVPRITDELELVQGLVHDQHAVDELTARALSLGNKMPSTSAALNEGMLARLPTLQRWVHDMLDAAGLPPATLKGAAVHPWSLRSGPGLAVAVGAAVYPRRDAGAVGLRDTLQAWSGVDVSQTAFGHVYEGAGTVAGADVESIESPFPLNRAQRDAISRAREQAVTVVAGPPGTGKSHLAAALAVDEVARGNSVLVATQSEHAADVIVDMLDRYPGPQHVRFGDRAHRERTALALADGLAAPLHHAEVAELHERLDTARIRRSGVLVRIHEELARELALVEGLQTRTRLAALSALVPNVDDPAFDVGAVVKAESRLDATGLFGGSRRRRAERRLRKLLGAAPVVSIDDLRRGTELARAEGAVRAGLAGGGVSLTGLWDALDAAEIAVREAAGAVVEARRRHRHNDAGLSSRAVAALASALRAGAVRRRTILGEMRAQHFLDVLPLWVGTLTEIDQTLPLEPGVFDVVIFDEASQIDQLRAAAALSRAKRVVVLGDPRQLRHVSFVSDERMDGAAEAHDIHGALRGMLDVRRNSLYDVAAGLGDVVHLDEHFRSIPHIIGFSDRQFYDGRLRLMTQHPANEAADGIHIRTVEGQRNDDGVNAEEVRAAVEVVHEATRHGETSIGVVTPFRAQADALAEALLAEFGPEELERFGIRAGTVHQFQGAERDVMIVSLAISQADLSSSLRFISDPNLFNVMITRARRRMVVVTSVAPIDYPTGLVEDYLEYAHHPPQPSARSDVPPGWIGELTTRLRGYSVLVVPNYPVAGWTIDMAVGRGEAAFGVECEVHPDGLDAHVERHLALRRAGWTMTDAFMSRWLAQQDEAVDSLVAAVMARDPDFTKA